MLPPVLAKDEVKDLLNGQHDFVGESFFDDIQYQFRMVDGDGSCRCISVLIEFLLFFVGLWHQ